MKGTGDLNGFLDRGSSFRGELEFEDDAHCVGAEYFIIQDRTWQHDADAVLAHIHGDAPPSPTPGQVQRAKVARKGSKDFYMGRRIVRAFP